MNIGTNSKETIYHSITVEVQENNVEHIALSFEECSPAIQQVYYNTLLHRQAIAERNSSWWIPFSMDEHCLRAYSSGYGVSVVERLASEPQGTTLWYEIVTEYLSVLSRLHSQQQYIGAIHSKAFLVSDSSIAYQSLRTYPCLLHLHDDELEAEYAFAPELLQGKMADAMTDIFAIGVLALSSMGAGTPLQVSRELALGRGIPLQVFSHMSQIEKDFFLKLTAYRRGDRFATAREAALFLFRNGIIPEEKAKAVVESVMPYPYPTNPIIAEDILKRIEELVHPSGNIGTITELAGEEGYGKTTLLRYTGVLAQKNGFRIRTLTTPEDCQLELGEPPLMLLLADDTKRRGEDFSNALTLLMQQYNNNVRLMCAHRTQIPQFGSRLHVIPMRSFTPEDILAYTEGALGAGSLPDNIITEIYKHSKGHPFYIYLFCVLLVRQGIIRYERSRWRLESTSISFPENIAYLIRELSGILTHTELSIAQHITGLIEYATLTEIADIISEQAFELIPFMEEFLRMGFIEREEGMFRAAHSFIHRSLLQQGHSTLYEQLRQKAEQAHAEEQWAREAMLLRQMVAFATTEQRNDLLAATELQRASSYIRQQQFKEALYSAQYAAEMFYKVSDSTGSIFARLIAIKALSELGRFDEVIKTGSVLLDEVTKAEFWDDAVSLMFVMAHAEERHSGNFQKAVSLYRRISEIAEELQARRTHARAKLREASALVRLQRYAPADAALLLAIALFTDLGDNRTRLETMCQRLELYTLSNDKPVAKSIAHDILAEVAEQPDMADVRQRCEALLQELDSKPDPLATVVEVEENAPLVLFKVKHEDPRYSGGYLSGNSSAVKKLREDIRLAAQNFIPVLFIHEAGDNPEVYARLIHGLCYFTNGIFSAVECSEFTAEELDILIFGSLQHPEIEGKVWRCQNGTLFLNNLHLTAHGFQQKILRLIEKQSARKIGSLEYEATSVRVIIASVQEKKILPDLYYKLLQGTIPLPSLNERRADIPLLAEHIVSVLAQKQGLENPPTIPRKLIEKLMQRKWSGSIAELEGVLAHLLLGAEDEDILPKALPPALQTPHQQVTQPLRNPEVEIVDIDMAQKNHILAVLESVKGNKSEAARLMNIKRTTLIARMKKYGIMP